MYEPFYASAVVNGKPWVMHTDGYFAVFEQREPRDNESVPADGAVIPRVRLLQPKIAEIVTDALAASLLVANREVLNSLRLAPAATCPDCGGTGIIECDECEGSGEVECVCRRCDDAHDAKCEECDGKRDVECACVTGTRGAFAPIPVAFAGLAGVYNRRAISAALKLLPPDLPIAIGVSPSQYLTIRCGDVHAVVVPMSAATVAIATHSVFAGEVAA